MVYEHPLEHEKKKNHKQVFVIPPLSYSLCELEVQHIRGFGTVLNWVFIMQTRINDRHF